MRTGEILDGAFRLYRLHFRAFPDAGLPDEPDVHLLAERPAPAGA